MGKTSGANKRVPGLAHRQHWHIGTHDRFLVAPSNRHCKHIPSSSGRGLGGGFFQSLGARTAFVPTCICPAHPPICIFLHCNCCQQETAKQLPHTRSC